MNFPGPTGRRAGFGFMLVFALLAAGILAIGCLYYRNYEQNYRAEVERQLSSIADLKVNELVQYRKERLGDANTFSDNPAFSELVRRFLDPPVDEDARRQLQAWLGRFQAYYEYTQIYLLDVQGAERLAVPNQPEPLPGHLAGDNAAALRSGRVTFLDFHRDAPGLPIHLEILVPIFDRLDTNRPLGVLILRINPAVLLYPYIRRWPVPSQTAETLLVRREGNEAVYLNELRFQTNAALNLRIPLANTNVPAVKAALGQTGIVAGQDYRDVPVIADVRAVPNSPWFLVTRQDVAEVFAPLRARLWQVIVMIGVLLFGSAAGVGLVWRQQRVWFYRAKYETEAFRAKLGAIVESSEYAIISKNLDGIITSWNPSAERIYGYSAAEAIGKSIGILIPPGHPNELPQLIEKIKRGEAVEHYETGRIRKNGERIQMSLSLSPVKNEAGAIVGVSVICYDITERKRAEEALRESRALYFSLAEQLPIGVFRKDREGRFVLVNPEFCRLKGMKAEDFLGKTPREVAAVAAAKQGEMGLATKYAATGIEHHEQILRTGKPIELVEEYAHADGRKQFLRVLKSPVMGPDGKIIGSQGIQLDITERKLAEETIAHERQLLRTLIDLLPETFYIKDLDSRFLVANEALAKQWGKASPSQLMGLSDADLFPAGQAAKYLDEDRKVFAGEPLMGREGVCVFADGREHMVLTTKVPYRDIQGRICGLVGFGYDITGRKQAEEVLRAKEEAYRQLFDASPDGIILIGPDARIVRANIAMARMYGYDSPDDLVGVCPTQFVALSSREYSEQILRRRLNGEDIKQVEYELVRKDGTTFYGETLATILRNEDGTVTGYICITRDTTERKRAEAALKESEVRYQRISEAITDYIYNVRVADGRAVETTHGPGCLAVTGYQAKEFANDPFLWFHMVAAEDRSKVEEQARRILAGEDPSPIEHRIGHKNGTERWVRNTFVPHRDERGVLATYDGLIQDITGRKQAEEEVARTAREWQATFDATKDAIWILDPNHQVLRSNKTAEQFFHRPCCEMIGKPCWEIVHGATEPIPDCPFVRSRKSGQRETMDLQIGERWFEIIVDPILDAAGQHAGAVHIVSDITERKRAEERIREQAALLDAANDAIYVRSLDDAMTYWNDGAERLYGWTRAEVMGRKIHDLIQYDRDAFETAQAALLDQGYWSGELKMTDKTGKAVIVFCRWTLLLDESGRPKEVLAINTDITERKQLEANFLRAQRMEGIGALAGGIAHDLNNILQPILMTAPLLRETTGDPESREMLDTVENCAQRGANIIKQLLTFARGEPSARVPLPVRHLLNEMNKLIQETFPKNIQLRVNVPKNLWQVLGDATQIHQALMNLCVNARDAMSNGGTLTLAAENLTLDEAFAAMMPGAKPGPYICVSVADTGMGIPPEHLDRIFDPFFTTKEIGKGTGLGLATVLGIARGHGGFVRVNSQTGKGTTFELYLPASPEAKAAARPKCEMLPPRAGGELILVVDDEASVRGVVRRALEKHGYQVATAAEGVEAMGLFAQHRAEIRAVLTDMMMPEMDGPSLVRALRHMEPQLPILGMTGVGEKADIKGLETLDLLVLLTKPFNSAVLLGVLHQALAAPRHAKGKS